MLLQNQTEITCTTVCFSKYCGAAKILSYIKELAEWLRFELPVDRVCSIGYGLLLELFDCKKFV